MNYFEKELFDLNSRHECTWFDSRENVYCRRPATRFFYDSPKHNLRCFCQMDTEFMGNIEDYIELSEAEFEILLVMVE